MAFSSRVRVYHAWQNADAELRRIKQAHERNRAQGKIATDRLGHSYSQIGEVRVQPVVRKKTKLIFYRCLGGTTGSGREAGI
jgi:hypothetical protein